MGLFPGFLARLGHFPGLAAPSRTELGSNNIAANVPRAVEVRLRLCFRSRGVRSSIAELGREGDREEGGGVRRVRGPGDGGKVRRVALGGRSRRSGCLNMNCDVKAVVPRIECRIECSQRTRSGASRTLEVARPPQKKVGKEVQCCGRRLARESANKAGERCRWYGSWTE